MFKLTNSLAALAILAAAGTAAAQPPVADPDVPTTVVSFADLDIGSAAGVRTLNARVYRAASKLCMQGGSKSLELQLAERRCMSTALASAKSGIEKARAEHFARMRANTELAAR